VSTRSRQASIPRRGSFKKAIELDPEFPVARLYLATAYMQQYVPGSDTPENKRNADSALEQFQLGSERRSEECDRGAVGGQPVLQHEGFRESGGVE